MTLKGASSEHEGRELPDRWPLDRGARRRGRTLGDRSGEGPRAARADAGGRASRPPRQGGAQAFPDARAGDPGAAPAASARRRAAPGRAHGGTGVGALARDHAAGGGVAAGRPRRLAAEPLLRRGRQEHVPLLAQLLLRRTGARRQRLDRQAPGGPVAAGREREGAGLLDQRPAAPRGAVRDGRGAAAVPRRAAHLERPRGPRGGARAGAAADRGDHLAQRHDGRGDDGADRARAAVRGTGDAGPAAAPGCCSARPRWGWPSTSS